VSGVGVGGAVSLADEKAFLQFAGKALRTKLQGPRAIATIDTAADK